MSSKLLLKMVVPRDSGTELSCEGYAKLISSNDFNNLGADFKHLFIENQASQLLHARVDPGDSVPFAFASTIFETSVAVQDEGAAGQVAGFQETTKICPQSTWPAFLTTRICGPFTKPPGNPPGACEWEWKGVIAGSCGPIRFSDEGAACFRRAAAGLLSLERVVARHSLLLGDLQLIANEFGITFFDTVVAQVSNGAGAGDESACGPGAGNLSSELCLRHSQVRNVLLRGAFHFLLAMPGSGNTDMWKLDLPKCEWRAPPEKCRAALFMAKIPPELQEYFQASDIGRELIGRLQALLRDTPRINAANGSFVCMAPVSTVAAHVGQVTKPPNEWSGQLLGSAAWEGMTTGHLEWDF
jgi:hypothetical protein